MPLISVLRNSIKPGQGRAVISKVAGRLSAKERGKEAAASQQWCEQNASDYEGFASELDPDLWQEALAFGRRAGAAADEKLAKIGRKLGGGANYLLLYFLVRHLQPDCVVETGVAAGFSSQSILRAMSENGSGRLWSSDLPYLRHDQPEQDIGLLVDQELRRNWTLMIEGDHVNLPKILGDCGSIDLVSYDSDKTYDGRRFAMQLLEPQLKPGGIVIMDDIQDNLFFRDHYTTGENANAWRTQVFPFEGKFLGLAERRRTNPVDEK